MIITIDGPSGVGKGTVGQKLADKLGFHLLDSGALYRLTALAAERQKVDFADEKALAKVARELDVVFEPGDKIKYLLAGEDVSDAIRQEDVGMNASRVGASEQVREALLQLQRNFARAPGLVADGRDMGTTVFPGASLKIFLSATAEERARRRIKQLQAAGQAVDAEQILKDIKIRDKQDRERLISPLKPADDAIEIDTTSMSVQQVLDVVLALV
ncbi:(d)CMP kinase [Pseudomaricurvus alcaniphilus]|uniref:(d)CMP kinase n=1 Tax=Pseudomaricurvus alcaniphilus TaxID=1166482 RepID=UPI00140A4ACB|nr:(d)CMP kinase [Pseudomaricurvus alcaniphilus]NHN36608.1 (d)CMP kinase [Pseudomaricurvus alcaniphilus]